MRFFDMLPFDGASFWSSIAALLPILYMPDTQQHMKICLTTQFGSIVQFPEIKKVQPLDFWKNASWMMMKENANVLIMLFKNWTDYWELVPGNNFKMFT